MAQKKPKCPICDRYLPRRDSPHFPFCSAKCKLVDLEAWLGGRYYVPGEPVNMERQSPEDEREDRGDEP